MINTNNSKMRLQFFLVFLTLLLIANVTGKPVAKTFINFLTDFLALLQQPLRLSTNTLCWDKASYVLLTKSLMKRNFLATPSKGNLTTYWPHEQQMFLIDLKCHNAKDILITASQQNLMNYPFHWLLLNQEEELPPNLNMYVRSKIYMTKTKSDSYQVISKYRFGVKSPEYRTNDITTWSDNKFLYYNKLTDARNRSDLMGLPVNVSFVVVNKETSQHLLDARERHVEPVTKVNYPLTLAVLDCINATGNILQRSTWGYVRSETQPFFEGMMGDMQNKTADICATPTFYVEDRIPYIDVIASTTPTKAKFIFRAPPLSYVKNVYILPFDKYVWLASLILLALIPVVFYVITYWEDTDEAFNSFEGNRNSVARLKPSLSDILQIEIGAACQQGSEAEPISRSGRIATICLFVAFMFLYTSYSANIVALLQSTTDSIKTLEDLLHSKIKLGVESTPYNKFYFTTQTGAVQQAIYNKKVAPAGQPNTFMSMEEGVRKMRDEYFAYHAECTSTYKVVSDIFREHEKCGLTEIEYYNMYEPYYAIRKNTTYGEIFKAAIRKMGERGIAHRAFTRIYLKKPLCQNQGGNFLSVSLSDCYAAFAIFITGFLACLIVFILEIIINKTH